MERKLLETLTEIARDAYGQRLTRDYIDACIIPPMLHGKFRFLSEAAFFTYLTPDAPVPRGQMPGLHDWAARGPVLWIGDVCASPPSTGLWIGKALRSTIEREGLAPEGSDRVAFWRRDGRVGWFDIRKVQ